MTVEEAIARFRARWDHPPIDPADVEERIALRVGLDRNVVVVPSAPAVRLFIVVSKIPEALRYRSVYLHSIADVDAALDALFSPASVSPPDEVASRAA